jgi:LPPG:FO 2-phospho-L-lactate transferase
MSDRPVQTMLETDEGELPFQNYFVERRCTPRVKAIRFEGAESALPAPGVVEAIGDPSNQAILIAPSNPYLSIDPILAVPGIRNALAAAPAPVIAVTPIIGGESVKGPTAKLMKELGVEVSPASVAAHYDGLIDGLLVDERDRDIGLATHHAFADTLMTTLDDRARVAAAALELASTIAKS